MSTKTPIPKDILELLNVSQLIINYLDNSIDPKLSICSEWLYEKNELYTARERVLRRAENKGLIVRQGTL